MSDTVSQAEIDAAKAKIVQMAKEAGAAHGDTVQAVCGDSLDLKV